MTDIDPDKFSCPKYFNPQVLPYKANACRKKQEWANHIEKDPKI